MYGAGTLREHEPHILRQNSTEHASRFGLTTHSGYTGIEHSCTLGLLSIMTRTHTHTLSPRVEAVDTTDASTVGRSHVWNMERWLELAPEGTLPKACRNGLRLNHYRSGCIGGTHQRPRCKLRLKSTGDLGMSGLVTLKASGVKNFEGYQSGCAVQTRDNHGKRPYGRCATRLTAHL